MAKNYTKRCSVCGRFVSNKDIRDGKVNVSIETEPQYTHECCMKAPTPCTHEFVSREYMSQPYGTCLSCGQTVIDG